MALSSVPLACGVMSLVDSRAEMGRAGCTRPPVSVYQWFPKFCCGLWFLPPGGLRPKQLGVCGAFACHPLCPAFPAAVWRSALLQARSVPSLGSRESWWRRMDGSCIFWVLPGSDQMPVYGWLLIFQFFLINSPQAPDLQQVTTCCPAPRDKSSRPLSTWKGLTPLCLVTICSLIGRTLSLLLILIFHHSGITLYAVKMDISLQSSLLLFSLSA